MASVASTRASRSKPHADTPGLSTSCALAHFVEIDQLLSHPRILRACVFDLCCEAPDAFAQAVQFGERVVVAFGIIASFEVIDRSSGDGESLVRLLDFG